MTIRVDSPCGDPSSAQAVGGGLPLSSGTDLASRARARAGHFSIHGDKASSAMETPDRDDDLAPVMVRLDRYAPAHARALEMAAYIRSIDVRRDAMDGRDRSRYADELEQCGQWIEFESYPEREASLLVAAKFCQRFRLCPFCALRRCARSLQDNAPRVRHALAVVRSTCPGASMGLLTLTVKNGEDLEERFEHLVDGWRALMLRRRHYLDWERNGRRGHTRQWTCLAAFSGGVYSIEIKRGQGTRGGGWHPHLHAAVIVEGDVGQERISAEWIEITGDSHVVDLRPFRSFVESDDPDDESIASDLLEVLKYPLKFNSITLPDNWHAELVLSGRRLRGTFGSLRGLKLDNDELTDYADQFAGEPFIRIAARWLDDRYIICEKDHDVCASPMGAHDDRTRDVDGRIWPAHRRPEHQG